MPLPLSDWLVRIQQQHPQAIAMGLDPVRAVVERMGLSRPAPCVITVAGTNGKGSTEHRKFKRPFRAACAVARGGASVGLAVVGASSESASPGGWGFGSAVRCDFPPLTDSGPSAALRARGRIGWSCGFRLGVVADSAIMRPPRAVRALPAGSALAPSRRALRSGRGWRGWLWVLRCWRRCAPSRRSGCRFSRRYQTRA